MNEEKKKVFDLIPAEDPIKKIILQARHQALAHEDLTDGAKALFCLLLDYSLWPSMNKGIGRVVIAAGALAKVLNRSKRSVGNWKHELEAARFIWVKSWHMPNTWPLDYIHINALVPPDDATQQPTSDGSWGNGTWRKDRPHPSSTAKNSTRCSPWNRKTLRFPKKFKTPEEQNSTCQRQSLPLAGAKLAVPNGRTCRWQEQITTLARSKKQHSL